MVKKVIKQTKQDDELVVINTQDKPQSITIDNKEYYVGSELMEYDKVYFTGCSRTIRKIIDLKKIPQDKYAYGNNNIKKGGWRLSDNQIKPPAKANLLLSKDWVESNVPKMMNGLDEKEVKEKYDCPEAPNIIDLDDNEKFKDEKGNPLEIETRGDRTVDGIYFSVCDIEKVFGLENIYKVLTQPTSGYVLDEHYCYFICMDLMIKRNNTIKKGSTKGRRMFLTYEGMIKLLYCSRSSNAKKFRKWATETLFTVQMGDDNEKQELASNLIGIPTKSLKQVLSKSASSVPCLYHFSLGIAKDLRKIMNIPKEISDDFIITKYGFTDDLERRTKEHEKTYGKIKGVKLELMTYIYIDPKYLAQAETDMKNYFETNEIKINYKNFKELIAFNLKHKSQINKQFTIIGNLYAGCVKDFLVKIDNLNHKIQLYEEKMVVCNEKMNTLIEKHQKELEHERHQKEHIQNELKFQIEMAKQQMELMRQKIEIDFLKNQLGIK